MDNLFLEEQFRTLRAAEQLDDLEKLLLPRHWDEVPFVSRLSRVSFLSSLDPREQSRLLTVHAARHLLSILKKAERMTAPTPLVMLSVVGWPDLAESDPVIPNYWITWDGANDLAGFRLVAAHRWQALLVAEWLSSDDVLELFDVLESSAEPADPDLYRVYIVRKGSPIVKHLKT
jgi:hypothetical protein